MARGIPVSGQAAAGQAAAALDPLRGEDVGNVGLLYEVLRRLDDLTSFAQSIAERNEVTAITIFGPEVERNEKDSPRPVGNSIRFELEQKIDELRLVLSKLEQNSFKLQQLV